MAVFGVDGRRVRQLVMGTVPAGTHQVTWDGRDDRGQQVAAGVYFYRLTAGDRTLTKKMVLIR
jgi:flagellar hook assembly protein FlgD